MSGEKIPYHLRPNKFVERALFVDLLGHVNRHSPMSEYLYVSFAGPYLEDFKVIHANFGNRKMLSLEQLEWVFRRQRFNVPYGCIECTNKTSQQFITDYNEILSDFGSPKILIWLDYAAANKLREQITEFESLVSKLNQYDILKITLNANPSSLYTNTANASMDAEGLRTRRLAILKEQIGDYLPNNIIPEQMKHLLYPLQLLRVIHKAASNAMAGHNNFVFHPITAYVYEDSHQMLTFTGILLEKHEVAHFLERTRLDRYEFASNNWNDVIRINVPFLSPREKFYLDGLIFSHTLKSNRSKLRDSAKLKIVLADTEAVNREVAERYIRFYRYYPHYHRVHY